MEAEPDPGWRPSIGVAVRIATLRPVEAPLLTTLRGITLFGLATSVLLIPVAWLASIGVDQPATNRSAASVLVAVVVVAGGLSLLLATRPPDATDLFRLAAFTFRVTVFRIVLGAAVGGAGLITAFVSGRPVLGLVGTIAAVVLIGLAAPTRQRIEAWQQAVDASGSLLSVHDALALGYHRER